MGIKIISEEIITPSSPTPHHLRNLKLSFLDQIATPIYIPVILFYDHHSSDQIQTPSSEIISSSLLKKSLADTLSRYYPLAGTLQENLSVDCDDVGVPYIESRVSSKLSEVIRDHNPKELNQFLPFEPYINETVAGVESREVLLAVKANFFQCGGLAIGVCVSHKITDGSTAFTFLNDWATTLRRLRVANEHEAAVSRIIDAASYFPPNDVLGHRRNISKDTTGESNIVTKRFVFNKSNIIALKENAIGSEVKSPTRVEAVSTFIWHRIMAIARSKPTQEAKAFAAVHVVNLRPRMDPPLPTHSFGNLWWPAMIAPSIGGNADHEYRSLVSQMRNALKKVDSEYVKMLQSDDGQMNVIKNLSGKFSRGGHEIEFCSFTSWCRFPMYEVDFGWGKPTWVFSPTGNVNKMQVILMSTKDGEGIEAWINLVDEDMDLFERDTELLSFVSSPSIINC